MRTIATAMVVLTVLVYGCTRQWGAGPPPAPPPPVDAPAANCTTREDAIPYEQAEHAGETIIIARCSLVRRYATVTRGDWNYSWYVFGFDVMSAERGAWPAKQVVFVAYDAWPTDESGIVLGKPAFPYAVGRVMAFYVRTDTSLPLITGQEWRSRVPSHGRPRPLSFNLQSEEGKRLLDRLWAAVRTFAEQNGWPQVTGASHFEETDDDYVLEVVLRTGGESEHRAVAVGKDAFNVREVP